MSDSHNENSGVVVQMLAALFQNYSKCQKRSGKVPFYVYCTL